VLKRISFVILIFVLVGLGGYWGVTAYNPSPDQEVVRVDYAYLGGLPEPDETCKYPDVPEIRVWGDGLAYYREAVANTPNEPESYWGRLSPTEMQDVIRGLWLRGIITDFEIGAPNPAGDSHELSVQLLLVSRRTDLAGDLSSQSGSGRAYGWLVEYLRGRLALFEPGTSGEARIDRLNLDRECGMPPPAP
jgi:hypothetical protein